MVAQDFELYVDAFSGDTFDVSLSNQPRRVIDAPITIGVFDAVADPNPNREALALPPAQGRLLRPAGNQGFTRPRIDYTTETLELRPYRPTAPGRQTTTLASPYSQRNPFSEAGRVRRVPVSVNRTGLPNQAGRGIGSYLPLAYSVASIVDNLTPEPCPWLTDEEFFNLIESDEEQAYNRINLAQTSQEVSNGLGQTCVLASTAALLLTFIPPTTAIGVALKPKAIYTCGAALAGLGINNLGQRVLRNNSIHRARVGTIRNGRPINADDCPQPTEREQLIRIADDCCFEIQFDPIFTKVTIPGLPDPVDGFRVNLLIQADTNINLLRVDWDGGTVTFPQSDNKLFISEQFIVTGSELDFTVERFEFTLSFSMGNRFIIRKYYWVFNTESAGTAVLPEWWPARPGADRPQLVITFAEERENGSLNRSRRFVMTIPHWGGDEPITSSPIGRHSRGKVFTELTLTDNSKIRLLARDNDEGQRVIDEALAVINPDLISGVMASFKPMENPDLYPEINVAPIRATYFPQGQQTQNPSEYYF